MSPEAEVVEALVELRAALTEKCNRLGLHCSWGDRGIPVPQLVTYATGDCALFIYEAGYHATIYPRVVYLLAADWKLHGSGIVHAVHIALRMEEAAPGMVARADMRDAQEVRWCDPKEPWWFEPIGESFPGGAAQRCEHRVRCIEQDLEDARGAVKAKRMAHLAGV